MDDRTCAACDCELETDIITVTLGGRAVEVCCQDCALLLGEAQAAIAGSEA
ncbi:hypothetical protein [Caulobacter sp. LARHSG274]